MAEAELMPWKLDKLEAILREQGRIAYEEVGHDMKPGEVPLETLAADTIKALRSTSASAEKLAEALRRMLLVFNTPENPDAGLPGAEQETCNFARTALSEFESTRGKG